MSVQGHPLKLPSIKPLRRHSLVWLARPPQTVDAADQPAADAWHARGLPFVVARQSAGQPVVGLGFCLPEAGHRSRRVAARCFEESVLRAEPPPLLERVAGVFAETAAAANALAPLSPRIFGSWMWRFLEGGPHTRSGSDIDLLVAASGCAEADGAVLALEAAESVSALRLDGELSFPCGEVSWREYAGRPAQILLKTVTDVRLVPFAELP